jgi:Kef-type K+ transport system membrane component KefB
LIPNLSDTGELETRFGKYLLSAGAVGEFGPILLLTLILSSQNPLRSGLVLIAFVVVAVLIALLAVRSASKTMPVLERTLEQSSQLAIRWIVVLVFALALLASDLGLDLLLGGFAAGLITRELLRGREVEKFESKMSAVGFGFFIPFFFVFSGMNLAIGALFQSPAGVVKLFVFLGLFLVVRGIPALVLYRKVLGARDRLALAFFCSTQLPLVLAITTIAVAKDHMRPVTAAALVGAAVLSTLIYPLVGLRLRESERTPAAEPAPT